MLGRRTVHPRRIPSAVTGLVAASAMMVVVAPVPAWAHVPTAERPAAAARDLGLPAAPTDVTVSRGRSEATISWVASPASADAYPVTGFLATAASQGIPGPTCAAAATATSCVISGITGSFTFTVQAIGDGGPGPASQWTDLEITDQLAPPTPASATALVGRKPGQVIVSWKPSKLSVGQSATTTYWVTAHPSGTGAGGDAHACLANAPSVSCTASGLQSGTTYRFEVVASSTSGSSAARTTRPLRIAPFGITGTVQAVFCSGSELEKSPVRLVRPSRVILDCDVSGPQYGDALIRFIDQITWSTWTTSKATGTGTLHWPTPIPCQPGVPASNCGVTPGEYPVTISLRNPQRLSGSKKYTFTTVDLRPTGTGPGLCETSCSYVPPARAYQE